MEQNPSEAASSSSSQMILRNLWTVIYSLPQSQKSATYHCSEPDQSSPRPPYQILWFRPHRTRNHKYKNALRLCWLKICFNIITNYV